LRLTTADKLHNFEAVACGNSGFSPLSPRQDGKIVLDGDAAGVEPDLLQQSGDSRSRRCLTLLAVDLNDDGVLHVHLRLKVPEV